MTPLRRVPIVLTVLLLVIVGLFPVPADAVAASSLGISRLTATPALSGADIAYQLDIQCAAVDESFCLDLTVTIPLPNEIEEARFLPHPYIDSWSFVRGVGLTATLISSVPAGSTGTIDLVMHTENGTTPDGYVWAVPATLAGSNTPSQIAVSDGEVSAIADIRVEKYLPGGLPDGERLPLDVPLRYTLSLCDPSDPTFLGNLLLETADLVDTLPAGATFIAASTTAGVVPSYDMAAGTVTWAGLSNQPEFQCGQNGQFWVEASYSAALFDDTSVVTNQVDVTGFAYGDAVTEYTDRDERFHRFGEPGFAGSTVKRANTEFYGSRDWIYAGDVLPQASESSWFLTLQSTSSIATTFEFTDPLPCLDNNLGTTAIPEYHSNTPDVLCVNPAWILESSIFFHPDVQAAIDVGYVPQVISTTGASYDMVRTNPTNYSYTPPVLPPGEHVSSVHLPKDPRLVLQPSASMQALGRLYGHAVADLPAGTMPIGAEIWNHAYVDLIFNNEVALSLESIDEMLVVEPALELNVGKTLSAPVAGNGHSYSINFSNRSPIPVTNAVVTDLLPTGFEIDYVTRQEPAGTYGLIEVIDNYMGSGRQLFRWTQDPTDPMPAANSYSVRLFLESPSWEAWPVGTTSNTAQISIAGAAGDEVAYCRYGRTNGERTYPNSSGSAALLSGDPLSVDTLDLDGDGVTVDSFCESERLYDRFGTIALLESEKLVAGDIDVTLGRPLDGFPTVGSASVGGTGSYRLDLTNAGNIDLTDVVVYDIFPFVGDTGVSESQLSTTRDSDWAPILSGAVVVPGGWTIEYSESTDPCRPEVSSSNVAAPDCVDDWSATYPGASATAFRLTFAGPFVAGSTESVSWNVTVPAGVQPGDVAWNSFAVAANRADTGDALIPTEPPKVGLAVPETDLSLAKSVTPTLVEVGDSVSYTIVVSHDGSIITDVATGAVSFRGAPSDARDVVVEDTLPAGVVLTAGTSAVSDSTGFGGGVFDEGTGIWTIGDIPVGGSATLSFDAVVTSLGSFVNTAEVIGNSVADQDSTPGNCAGVAEDDCDSATVVAGSPSISLEKSVETTPGSGVFIPADGADGDTDGDELDVPYATGLAGSGEAVTYQFVVTNTGTLDLESIVISDPAIEFFCTGFDLGTLTPSESVTVWCSWPLGYGSGRHVNSASVLGETASGTPVTDSDDADVFVPEPAVTIEKATNGVDADLPGDAVALAPGDAVTWTYVVTNTGEETLTGISVSDTIEGAIVCPFTVLAPAASMTCTETGVSVVGLYANTGSVGATGETSGLPVQDSDPSHYLVIAPVPAIAVEKATNGIDADLVADSVALTTGDAVTWSYVVTNTGPEVLNGVTVSDDLEGVVTCPASVLASGASMTCTAIAGVAVEGAYVNVATANGIGEFSSTGVSDTDASNYVATTPAPAVMVEKTTNGVDADLPADAVALSNGDVVTWSYLVTNSGADDLVGISLADDLEGAVTCPAPVLAAGASMTCTAIVGAAGVGLYANVATVSATGDISGVAVSDTDPSHYRALAPAPSITIEKATNGVDADLPADAPVLTVGDEVTWSYVVTNNGDEDLVAVTLDDDVEGAIACPATILAIGDAMTCLRTGIVDLGAYANIATVTATGATSSSEVTSADPSHYNGTLAYNVSLQKTGAAAGNDTIAWTITLANAGPQTAPAGLVVVDDLADGLTVASLQDTGWACVDVDDIVTCTLENPLPAGSQQTFVITTTVAASASGEIANTAVLANSVDPTNSNNAASSTLIFTVTPPTNAGVLAFTGAQSVRLLLLAAILAAAGAGLLALSRRRRIDLV